MAARAYRWALFSVAVPALFALCGSAFQSCDAQVFVVGENSATAGISTDFSPTNLPLPEGHLSERGRRELVRDLEAEQGFAHRVLPMGPGLVLNANGPLTPGPDAYKKMIFEKGASSAVGDRVVVTALTFKADRIFIDLNGGPYSKHRFLSHLSFGNNPVSAPTEQATGSRVTLVFKDGIPEISASEVKALLTPVVDFGAKTASDAYADTLPAPVRETIAAHEILVGMDRRMVLASVGAPESKVREHPSGEADGGHFEEWIYGHVPRTVKFVRFNGDRVVLVKVAALGKPIEIHNQNEMGEFGPPVETRTIALGDRGVNSDHPAPAPTLREPGEVIPMNNTNRVQYPPPHKTASTEPDHPDPQIPQQSVTPDASQPAPSNVPSNAQPSHFSKGSH